jgi:prepilin-type N-terminal cleavage/methylation domain-containing protein
MMKKLPKLGERGFSLVEALVTLVLLTVILLMLYELMIGSMRASMFVESRNDLEIFAQRTVNDIQAAILQSRIMYEETGIGPGYRTLLTNSDLDWSIYANSRLPIVDDSPGAIMEPDAGGDLFVGNSILLVRALEPVPIPFDHDEDGGATTPNIDFLVDRYRLEFYFLTENSSRSFNGSGEFIDLMRARSVDFADYFQLSSAFAALSAAQQNQIADGMLDPLSFLTEAEATRLEVDGPIDQAWDPTVAVTNAFYDMDDAGVLTAVPGGLTSLDLRKRSMLPEFEGGRMSGKIEYSVCTNANTLVGGRYAPLGIQDIVPLFADETGNEFPGGFEIKSVGPSGARVVWNRLVLCSEHMREIDSQESIVITSAREF